LTVCAVLLLSACFKSIQVDKPLISEEKLTEVLKDIHVAEALLTETNDRRIKDSLARIYYAQIFRLHEISPEDFDQSMNAYFTDPAALDSLYQKVILNLSVEKKELTKKNGD
jgi:hypothetical protein